MKNNPYQNYSNYSKDFLTSIIFLTPFIALYELLCYFLFKSENYVIRNSADVIIRNSFSYITSFSQLYYFIIICIIVIIYFLYNYEKYDGFYFSLNYYFKMIIEGLFYSIILLIIINGIDVFNTKIIYDYNTYLLNFYSSLGAGVWEEVFFRLFIFNFLSYMFLKLLKSKNKSIMISLILSSLLFSIFHYYGNLADLFLFNTFIIRFVAGIILCLIYIKRGLGITCFTHLTYDVLIFSLPLL